MKLLNMLYNSRTQIFFSLGVIQIMQNLLPLLAYPWLGRVLGPESFGLLMYMGLIPPVISIMMDWGMQLGAVREIGRAKKLNHLGILVGSVFSAKLMLAILCLAGSIIAMPFLPYASEWPFAYFMAVSIGIIRGISPLWYFQGTGKRVKVLAFYDVLSTLLILLLMLFFIRQPTQWSLYLLFMALCKGLTWFFLDVHIWRTHKARLNFKNGLSQIRQCNVLFVSAVFGNIQNYGTQLLLGYFLSTSQVGIYVAVSKMIRALVSLATPLSQTIFPQICNLAGKRKELVRKILGFSLSFTFLTMLLVTVGGWLCAPWVIKIALGSSFQEATPVLRVMILAVPLLALNLATGEQLLVAMHMEKKQAIILGLITVIGLFMTVFLVRGWQLAGAAWLPVIMESLLFIGYWSVVIKNRSCFL